ncbi:MAG: hypothetical protein S4CHLAM37_07230 [Chlamydiia bacterium]|nr:hypothetical protein [Chlamydiia bacterium]
MGSKKIKLLTYSLLLFGTLLSASVYTGYSSYQNQFLPFYQHYLSAVQTNGEILEIDDGSLWKVNRYHARKVLYWHTNDVIEITPTNSYRSERFYITNKTKGTHVLAELSHGPICDNPFTNHVSCIDRGEVYLMSVSGLESRWVIDSKDTHKLINWQPEHAVIIGKDYNWGSWFTSSEVILINVENNDYVRARLF